MIYTVIYVDKNDDVRKWKHATNLTVAEEFGRENSDNDYDICVSMYEYDRVKEEVRRLEQKLEQIKSII